MEKKNKQLLIDQIDLSFEYHRWILFKQYEKCLEQLKKVADDAKKEVNAMDESDLIYNMFEPLTEVRFDISNEEVWD